VVVVVGVVVVVVEDVVEVVVVLDVLVLSVPASDVQAAATRARTIVVASTRRIGHLYSRQPPEKRLRRR